MENETVYLAEEYSALFQRNILKKLKNSDNFTLSSEIGISLTNGSI